MTGKQKSVRNSDSKPGPATLEGKARSLANLRPWKPGESGNAAGRTGGLIAIKLGRLRRIAPADLAAFIARKREVD